MNIKNKSLRIVLMGVAIVLLGVFVTECSSNSSAAANTNEPIIGTKLNFTTGQAADVVIGQADMASNTNGSGMNQFGDPWGNPVVSGTKLLVSDDGNNRILVFNTIPTAPNATADLALTSHYTSSLAVSNSGALFAGADDSSVPIPFWNSIPVADVAPDHSLGNPLGRSITQVSYTDAISVVGNKMIAADAGNSRIMVWIPVPTSDTPSATFELGQADFISGSASSGVYNSAGPYMDTPEGVTTDNDHLYVSDTHNNRILGWSSFPSGNSAPDFVLGQTDFTGNTSGLSATAFNFPSNIVTNGVQLFACDTQNNRVLIWNTLPTTTNAAPDVVLGQPDFVTNTALNPPTANSLNNPTGIYVTDTQLFVVDRQNHRVLIYNGH